MALPTRLSYSALSLFRSCPTAWKARYVDKVQEPAGPAARFGNDFDTLVAFTAGLKPKGRNGEAVAEPEKTDELGRALGAYAEQPWSWLRTPVKQEMRTQVEINVTPEQWRELAEQYGAWPEIAYPILGYADFVRTMDDGVRLETLDLKTSERMEFKPEWNLQSIFYAAALGASKASIHLVVRGKKEVRCDKHELLLATNKPLVKQVLDWFSWYSSEVKRVIDAAEFSDLPRSPGYHCRWCPVAADCATALAVK